MSTNASHTAERWILVVDDEADLRDIICTVLEEQGHHAVGAADGREALDRLHNDGLPVLVLLDLMMPGMNGWEFRRAQLDEPELARIPVLVLSGDGEVERKAADLSAAGYLRKPITLENLISNVDRAIEGSAAG